MKIKVIEFNKESHVHTKYPPQDTTWSPLGGPKLKTVQTPCGENVNQSELSHISGRETKAATTLETSLVILIFPLPLLRENWPSTLSKKKVWPRGSDPLISCQVITIPACHWCLRHITSLPFLCELFVWWREVLLISLGDMVRLGVLTLLSGWRPSRKL